MHFNFQCYGGILQPTICKINYDIILHNFVNNGLTYVNIKIMLTYM